MDRLKTFGMYILWVILLYIFVSLTSYAFIMKAYKNINEYEVLTASPKIEVVESKSTYVNGYVVAKVTNDTGTDIDKAYVKLDLYSENDNYLGTKYNELNNFSNGKVLEAKTNFRFNGVDNYKISVVDSIAAGTLYDDREELRNGLFKLFGISGLILFLYYIF